MRGRVALLTVALLAPALLAGACTGPAQPTPVASQPCGAREPLPVVEAAYGSDDLMALDVYPLAARDDCRALPVLVWVHGGAWQTGDKGNRMADKRRLAAAQGWLLVSVNYRLVPDVRYPVPNEDVASAVAWVIDHASDYGGDPARVALMGHSAGAGIVAAITTDERYLAAHGLTLSVVDCAVALDTEGYDVAARADDVAIYEAMFGDDPALWPDMSPVTHVEPRKDIPDYLIVTRGRPARVATAQQFTEALRAALVPTTVVVAAGLSHEDVNAAVGRPGLITESVVGFLNGCWTA